jgi:hypothetical protein
MCAYRMLSVLYAKKQSTRLDNENNVQTVHKGKTQTNIFDYQMDI